MSVQRQESGEMPGTLARAVEPAEPAETDAAGKSPRPRSLRGGWVLVRLLVTLGLLCVAAVLVVEGILIKQIGTFEQERPLIGRVTDIQRGETTSVVAFEFVTLDGHDRKARCEVPNSSLERAFRTPGAPLPVSRPGPTPAPGQTLEILHRRGVLGIHACPREGLASLHATGTRIGRWGLLFGALSLAMLAWLIVDLWRYTRTLGPRVPTPPASETSDTPSLRGSLEP